MQTEGLEKQIITWMLPGLSPGWIEEGDDDTVVVFLSGPWRESSISSSPELPLTQDFTRRTSKTRRSS
jgi:hypothetical protein